MSKPYISSMTLPVMPLVELIRGLLTSEATRSLAAAFIGRLGKTAIDARNSPGFAVNRILCPMLNEAIFALQDGVASAADIDAGMKLGCSHPIGPLALADLIDRHNVGVVEAGDRLGFPLESLDLLG